MPSTDHDRASRRGEPSRAGPREILLVGDARDRDAVVGALEQHAPHAVGFATIDEAVARVGDHTAAIVLLAEDEPRVRLRRLRARLGARDVPVLMLLGHDTADDERVGELYDIGATAVLGWPDEALLLPGVLLALHREDDVVASEDPLEQAVRDRLAADKVLGEAMDIRVLGATAVIRGSVASAWERSRLRRVVEAVPGITRVIDHGVSVTAPKVADADLRTIAEALVLSAGNADGRRLRVEIEKSVATVRGTASTRGTVTRVCNAVRQVPGVTRVFDGTDVDGS